MITLITGVPGGGKTYLAVKHLLDQYYEYDKKEHEFKKKKEVTIITNIEDFQLDHINLDEEIERQLGYELEKVKKEEDITDREKLFDLEKRLSLDRVRYFFNEAHQEFVKEKYGSVIYVIDECQKYFDYRFARNKWSREVYNFFEVHRHFGMDIFLITQNARKLTTDIRVLSEKEIRALPRSLNLMGELKYNEYINGMKANAAPKVVRPNKRVFGLYKSMSMQETEKIKSPIRRFLIVGLIVFAIGSFVLYKNIFAKYGSKVEPPKKVESAEKGGVKGLEKKMENRKSLYEQTISVIAKGRWVRVSYSIENNNLGSLKIVDPVSRELLPYEVLGYKMKFFKNDIFCYLDAADLASADDARASELASESPPWVGSRDEPSVDYSIGNDTL
jgi:zona occludens toxin (predicted ATPase)